MALRKLSKKEFDTLQPGKATFEEIKVGALQRIADALELAARDREKLERDKQRLSDRCGYLEQELGYSERRIRGLKATITRMKNKEKRT